MSDDWEAKQAREEGKVDLVRRPVADQNRLSRVFTRIWGEQIRYPGLRLTLVAGCVALLVLHALAPKSFRVDLTSVALILIGAAVLLEPLLESVTFPGGAGVVFRKRVNELTEVSAQFSQEAPTFEPEPRERQPQNGGQASAGHRGAAGRNFDRGRAEPRQMTPFQDHVAAAQQVADNVLEEASLEPRLGLMSIYRELELEANRLLAVSGWGRGRRRWPLRQAVDTLIELGQLPPSTAGAIRAFMEVRNLAVHGVRLPDEEAITQAVLAGTDIYLGIASIPREVHVVDEVHIDLYSDDGLTQKIEDARGVALLNYGLDSVSRQVFPTTRDHFLVGDEVAWGWGSQGWGAAWYHDRESQSSKKAFDGALEFTGPPLRLLGF